VLWSRERPVTFLKWTLRSKQGKKFSCVESR
jgi:hypothetical protein